MLLAGLRGGHVRGNRLKPSQAQKDNQWQKSKLPKGSGTYPYAVRIDSLFSQKGPMADVGYLYSPTTPRKDSLGSENTERLHLGEIGHWTESSTNTEREKKEKKRPQRSKRPGNEPRLKNNIRVGCERTERAMGDDLRFCIRGRTLHEVLNPCHYVGLA